jgi:hypothetical protein
MLLGSPIDPNKYKITASQFSKETVYMRVQYWLYSTSLEVRTAKKNPRDEINIKSLIKIVALYTLAILSFFYTYFFENGSEEVNPTKHYGINECPLVLGKSYRYPVFKTCLNYSRYDVGEFILRGPFCHYLKKVQDKYMVDLSEMSNYNVKPNMHQLGCIVTFEDKNGKLSIVSTGTHDEDELVRKILICSMNTHSSIVRHTTFLHFVLSEDIAINTRTHLKHNTNLFKILWPHVYGVIYTNKTTSAPILSMKGDYENIFSYGIDELSRLMTNSYETQLIDDYDPECLLANLPSWSHNYPEIMNRLCIYAAIKKYVTEHIFEKDLEEYRKWFSSLLIVKSSKLEYSLNNLERLCSVFIYNVMIEHEIIGAGMWDFQTWCNHIYPHITLDRENVSKDVHQTIYRYIHTLAAKRHKLMGENTNLKKYIIDYTKDIEKNDKILQILASDIYTSVSA